MLEGRVAGKRSRFGRVCPGDHVSQGRQARGLRQAFEQFQATALKSTAQKAGGEPRQPRAAPPGYFLQSTQ